MARIAIIGGGPAGSTAAFHLATNGHEVTLIERSVFPRTKVCGEFISPAATRVLEAILPERTLLDAGARHVSTITIGWGRRSSDWPMPAHAWAISRATLDQLLLNRARDAGAQVLQPCCVRSVEYEETRVRVRLSDGFSLTADLVIHADGTGRHDPAGPIPCDHGLIALKCHYDGAGPVGVRMEAAPGAYIGSVRIEGGRGTYALVARRHLVAKYGNNIDALVSALSTSYSASSRAGQWFASGVPRSLYKPSGHQRSFRIGNAAAAVDPVGGEGIGLAIWSGTMLGALFGDSRADFARIHRILRNAYGERLRLRFPVCHATAWALMRPWLISGLSPVLRIPSLTLAPWYVLSGKTQVTESAGIPT